MKLIPELRKASIELDSLGITVGLVDCTTHTTLCQQAGVNQYPTLILFNQSTVHSLLGLHAAADILQFVDVGDPVLNVSVLQKYVFRRTF